eukprot:scaffold1535_cov382-Prasinococcus_capsulatus_cf.AAC.46
MQPFDRFLSGARGPPHVAGCCAASGATTLPRIQGCEDPTKHVPARYPTRGSSPSSVASTYLRWPEQKP